MEVTRRATSRSGTETKRRGQGASSAGESLDGTGERSSELSDVERWRWDDTQALSRIPTPEYPREISKFVVLLLSAAQFREKRTEDVEWYLSATIERGEEAVEERSSICSFLALALSLLSLTRRERRDSGRVRRRTEMRSICFSGTLEFLGKKECVHFVLVRLAAGWTAGWTTRDGRELIGLRRDRLSGPTAFTS